MSVGFFRSFLSALCRAACNACTQDAHPVEPAQLPDPPAEVAAEAPHFCILLHKGGLDVDWWDTDEMMSRDE